METLFEKFNIISCLKKTEFSSVYLADHIILEKRIILKTLDSNKTVDNSDLARFKREAQILAKLTHPNIIRVLDFGSYQNFVYISFEYFPAQTLRETINARKINDSQKTDLLQQAATGLDYAHKNDIIHRDIKPENILVDENLQLKIADFGLAMSSESSNLTEPQSVMGTPAYVSPEQVSGAKVTPASDIFSLGLVAYELFYQSNPVLGKDLSQTINNIINYNSLKHNELVGKAGEAQKKIIKDLLDPDPAKRNISAELIKDEEDINKMAQPKIPPALFWMGTIIIMIVLFFLVYNNLSDYKPVEISNTPEKVNNAVQEKLALKGVNDSQPTKILSSDSLENKPEKSRKAIQNNIISKAILSIESIPPAVVFINSKDFGNTAQNEPFELKAGNYQITLKAENFPDYKQNIALSAGENMTFSINLNEQSGLLQIFAYPWAVVVIDDKEYGQTPFEKPIRLNKGVYQLDLRNPGFEAYKRSFEINGNDTVLVQHNFNQSGFGTKIE